MSVDKYSVAGGEIVRGGSFVGAVSGYGRLFRDVEEKALDIKRILREIESRNEIWEDA